MAQHYPIVNNSIQDCIFPDKLKLADITLLYKKDDKTDKKNYIPISILPVVSKIFEHIMQTQIVSFGQYESGGTFFIGFIIEYLAKLNAIILIIYSSRPFNVVCELQEFVLRGSD